MQSLRNWHCLPGSALWGREIRSVPCELRCKGAGDAPLQARGWGEGRGTPPLGTCHFRSYHPSSSMFCFVFFIVWCKPSVFSLISLLLSPRVRTWQTTGLTKQSTTRSASSTRLPKHRLQPPTGLQLQTRPCIPVVKNMLGLSRGQVEKDWSGMGGNLTQI